MIGGNNVTLTIAERDAIDGALSKLLGCHAISLVLTGLRGTDTLLDRKQRVNAEGLVSDALAEAIIVIEGSLKEADGRRQPIAAKRQGAR